MYVLGVDGVACGTHCAKISPNSLSFHYYRFIPLVWKFLVVKIAAIKLQLILENIRQYLLILQLHAY